MRRLRRILARLEGLLQPGWLARVAEFSCLGFVGSRLPISGVFMLALYACPGVGAAATTPRTDAICKQSLEQRRSLADRGDPDGIYCLAMLYAARYGDERYPDAEREDYGAHARLYVERAKALGYPVDSIERDIVGGDNITRTGSYFGSHPRDPSGEQMSCLANIGISCAAQCGASGGTCYSQCLGGSAWQCR